MDFDKVRRERNHSYIRTLLRPRFNTKGPTLDSNLGMQILELNSPKGKSNKNLKTEVENVNEYAD